MIQDTHYYPSLFIGVVVDNEDPECLGRVRVRIPGLIEPASAWAYPLGTVGGGSNNRGFFAVPEKGAEIGVFFNFGDPDHPWYLSGHWGKPNGNSETPEPIQSLSKSDAPKVQAFETNRYLVTFDNRMGNESLLIKDKNSGDQIEFDGLRMGITIQATTALMIKARGLINIEAAMVQINGRVVSPSSKPI